MDTEKRIEQLKEFRAQDPDDAFLAYALAQEYLKVDRADEALELFEELLEAHPDYLGTYYHLGKLLASRGETERAQEIYKTGIEVAQEQGDTHSEAELRDALMEVKGVGFD